jgi:hypothetical protein
MHVLDGSKPILVVSRADGGDWCFLCGDGDHDDASSVRAVVEKKVSTKLSTSPLGAFSEEV